MRFDLFKALTLDISFLGSSLDSKKPLSQCINAHFATQVLNDSKNLYECTKCKRRSEATQKLHLVHSPPVLIFHLNRFKQNFLTGRSEKNESFIDFPLTNLDMTEYYDDKRVKLTYDLFGIVNHTGGLRSGHYVAITRNPETGIFHRIDDKNISYYKDNSRAVNMYAYLLFYVRNNLPLIKRAKFGELYREGRIINSDLVRSLNEMMSNHSNSINSTSIHESMTKSEITIRDATISFLSNVNSMNNTTFSRDYRMLDLTNSVIDINDNQKKSYAKYTRENKIRENRGEADHL